MNAGALLETRGLVKRFDLGRGRQVHAVRGVDLQLARGQALGLVGESGCGKSTLARCVLRLLEPTGGQIVFDGTEITHLTQRQLRPLRRRMQIVFQDPQASLDPRMTVEQTIAEPLAVQRLVTHRVARKQRIVALLEQVGLHEALAGRYPHQLSAGQRQRVGIARALAVGPSLLVADEPISALDVSIQAQVVNLLLRLQQQHQLSYLFISHDLAMVRHLCDEIAVMYLGRVVERGPAAAVGHAPRHPYSRALVAALGLDHTRPGDRPGDRPSASLVAGEPPSPLDPPPGCAFHPRCPLHAERRSSRCRELDPELLSSGDRDPEHLVACHEI